MYRPVGLIEPLANVLFQGEVDMKTRLLGIIGAATTAALLTGVLLLTGSGGAIRLPVRSHGPAGVNIENRQLDLSFLQAGR